jgi:hypothetical protein
MIALDQITPANFLPLVGAPFQLQLAPERNAHAELISVTPFTSRSSQAPRKESFSVLFRVSGCGVLEQKIYRMSNEQFGEAEIFLVPVACDQRGCQMEAVFN